jgi:cellulose synthase/poly-beta-1,6-N-acetylglucosamine synthase-like glycosyltransferase
MIVPFLPNPITVGICAYNEGNNIGKLLQNVLSDQKLSGDSEVLVVCSGCTDNTADVVNEFAAKDSRVKAYFEKERNGKASAINYILSKAKSDTILFISADTLPKKGAFKKLTHKLQTPNVGIVSGNPVPVNSTNSLVGRIVQLMWHFHGHVFEELNDAGLARHATEIFCVRRGIVDTMPVETVNDDAFIAVTAKKKGWLIKYSSEAQVSMCGPKTFREYFQQRRRVIFGHYQLRRLTGESPQYLVHLLPLHPVKTVKLVLWLFTRYDPVTLSTFMLTEFLVNTTAIFDFVSRRTHFQWTVLPSTKIVIPRP